MTTRIVVSRDGTWKIEVEVFETNWLVYRAIGVKTRVYARRANGRWRRQRVDEVAAGGQIGSSLAPGVMVPLADAPALRRGVSHVDARTWRLAQAVSRDLGPSAGRCAVDRVTGSGWATWRGETLRAGPVSLS